MPILAVGLRDASSDGEMVVLGVNVFVELVVVDEDRSVEKEVMEAVGKADNVKEVADTTDCEPVGV